MLKQEFEDRTGCQVSQEEFDRANMMYMQTNLDKDEFCKEWKILKDSKAAADMAFIGQQAKDLCRTTTQQMRELQDINRKTSRLLEDAQQNTRALRAQTDKLEETIRLKDDKISRLLKELEELRTDKEILHRLIDKVLAE